MLRKILKWVWEVLEVIIIAYVIFMTSYILCRNKYGYTDFFEKYTFVTVNEDNQKLLPTHNSGDLLIVKNQQFNINPGDLIYYYVTVNEKYVVRSGVVASKVEDDVSALYTLDDEKTSVSSIRVLGKYVSVHPGIGSVLDVLVSRVGFLFLVLLPVLIVFIYQVYQLVVVEKYEVVADIKNTKKVATIKNDDKSGVKDDNKSKEVKKNSDVELL